MFRRFFYPDDEDVFQVGFSNSGAIFAVADECYLFLPIGLEKLYGRKAYAGLRIPDADTSSRQNIDIVLVTEGEAVVISVMNLSGVVSIDADGTWVCTGGASKRRTERQPNPVVETKQKIAILESYLEQGGVTVSEGYFSCRVICPNPNLSTSQSNFPSEVIIYEQWNMLTGWNKGSFGGVEKEIQEPMKQKLHPQHRPNVV